MLGENREAEPSGSDFGGLLADLLEGARRRNLSANSLAAYERTWRTFLAWAAAASLDPRTLSFPAPEAYRFLGEGKNGPSIKQIRAALSFAYRHWDLKNPFSKIDPPLAKEPQIHYLLLPDIRRLLDYLSSHQQGYGSSLAFHLANALFQTACRFDELIQLTWADCQAVGKEIVALRIKGKGSVFQDVPVTGALSAALLEWRDIQETFKGKIILAPGGIAFATSPFVFAGYSGAPFSNRAFNLRLRAACRALRVGRITAHGLRHSAATILLNHVGKDLREIQELLRHKNIRTTVRYTHVGYEQTRQTAEALSRALE
jgi:integrase/recombinase XerD